MASSLSKKEVDDMFPFLDKTVQKFLGFREPSLVTTAMNCLTSGYDKRKTTDTLASLLDDKKASHLADKIFNLVEDMRPGAGGGGSGGSRKRVKEDLPKIDETEAKKTKLMDDIVYAPVGAPGPDQLSALQIREMMVKAQRMIEERKRALSVVMYDTSNNGVGMSAFKAKKIAELQAQIQSKFSNPALLSQMNEAGLPPLCKPAPLILDDEGRTVDVTGKQVQLTQRQPTLKANIRAKKREEFRIQLQEKVQDVTENEFFDQRVHIKGAARGRRNFRFHEPGKFQQIAARMRMKAQLDILQGEISQIAKKTGISSVTKLAMLEPRKDATEDEIPLVEWWDATILKDERLVLDNNGKPVLASNTITSLIEHPTQLRCPDPSKSQAYLPVFLTKKERRKLRRQTRRDGWKEKQEKIRLGLEATPEPKVRMSNLMRVLGNEAIQDPTKIEAHVREQMAKRRRAHEEANAQRKLSQEQKREKKIRKMQEDTTQATHVSVYRVNDLNNPSKKFKVETNIKQLLMTGSVILFKDCNVIVVEGGPKQQKKYKRLMLHRIKWVDNYPKGKDVDKTENKCVLVWEGLVRQRTFGEVKFKMCATESIAREHFKRVGVEHYWDLAYSGAVLEASQDA